MNRRVAGIDTLFMATVLAVRLDVRLSLPEEIAGATCGHPVRRG